MSTLERAIAIAVKAHEGTTDKGGHPYILHPLRVMLQMSTIDEQIAAVLHDVIEDSQWTLAELKTEGFSVEIMETVDALTRRTTEMYADFIRRIRCCPIARTVKISDLHDNMDLSRISHPTDEDRMRGARYLRAKMYLLEE